MKARLGFVIAVLGTDGAGKSTIIQVIKPFIFELLRCNYEVKHLRPSLLPPLARLKGGKEVIQDGPVTNPHGSKPSGMIGSLFRIIYLMLDYIFGYWLVVLPLIRKKSIVIIYDRYAYDMALDPRRFRIGFSSRIASWFTKFAPKPDLIFCLYGNPAVIVARKNELSLEEVRRQTEALIEFAKLEPRAVLISTDTSIDETRDQVLQTLCAFLENRAKGHL